jgi:serine/threonine protein phosphatase PrpC
MPSVTTKNNGTWHIIGESVRGVTHDRKGLPNQDAIQCIVKKGNELPLAVAVSDGHGNSKNFRSEIGAQLAANIAGDILIHFLSESCNENISDQTLNNIQKILIPEIIETWKKAVLDHFEQNPILKTEQEVLKNKNEFSPDVDNDLYDPIPFYGTTLLAAGVSESLIILLQLGDGDILTVDPFGKVIEPMPRDDNLFADETTSLCLPNAEQYMRHIILEPRTEKIKLLLISTDGYSKSFIENSDFLEVGPDFLELLENEGISTVQDNLKKWLDETSKLGSGDDITLGIVYHER